MSPRAAWQLEAMGFEAVHDFVGGKLEWIRHDRPLEGPGPHYAVSGQVATMNRLLVARIGDRAAERVTEMGSGKHDFCVVVNDHYVVLGRLRKSTEVPDPSAPVEEVMELGPTTIRPVEPAEALLGRMTKRNVPAILVTTTRGKLIGIARRADLERLVGR